MDTHFLISRILTFLLAGQLCNSQCTPGDVKTFYLSGPQPKEGIAG